MLSKNILHHNIFKMNINLCIWFYVYTDFSSLFYVLENIFFKIKKFILYNFFFEKHENNLFQWFFN